MGLSEVLAGAGAEEGAKKITGRDVGPLIHAQNALLTKILEKLDKIPEGLRQSLADHLWAELPSTFSEIAYSPSATSAATQAQTQGSVRRVEALYTFCGGNQTGWLQIGNALIIPLPAGAWFINGLQLPMQDGDARTISLGTPGALSSTPALVFAGLWGHVLPRFGEFT